MNKTWRSVCLMAFKSSFKSATLPTSVRSWQRDVQELIRRKSRRILQYTSNHIAQWAQVGVLYKAWIQGVFYTFKPENMLNKNPPFFSRLRAFQHLVDSPVSIKSSYIKQLQGAYKYLWVCMCAVVVTTDAQRLLFQKKKTTTKKHPFNATDAISSCNRTWLSK